MGGRGGSSTSNNTASRETAASGSTTRIRVDAISGAAISQSQIDSNSSRANDAREQLAVITDVYNLSASDAAIVNAMCYYGTGIYDAYIGARETSDPAISANFMNSARSLEGTINSLKNRLSVDDITAESIADWIIDNNTPR